MHIREYPLSTELFKEEIIFFLNGNLLKARVGQTVAAALIANGIKQFGVSRKLQQPRGLFCGNGRCCSCFVSIDGKEHVQSCMVVVEMGMEVEFNSGDPLLGRR